MSVDGAGLPLVGPLELGVFVPGLLGAGILLSIALAVSDLVALVRGRRRRARRASTRAVLLARSVVGPALARTPAPPRRLAARWVCGLAGVAALALGAYVLVGAFFNFWDLPIGTRWSDQIAWLWAVLNLAGLAFAAFGAGAITLAVRGHAAPARLDAWVLRTPLGRRLEEPAGVLAPSTPGPTAGERP